jgi:hypothetical protein
LRSRKDDNSPIFSSIDWIAIFSVNRPMRLTADERLSHYWLPAYRVLSDPKAEDFLEKFRNSWNQHVAKITGVPIQTKNLGTDLNAISL